MSDPLQEPLQSLSADTLDLHRALVSLEEELEAVDWYGQRADACGDAQLKAVFLHNRGEEIEHATMLMEWLRRHDGRFGEMMKALLFTEAPIASLEASGGGGAPAVVQTLGIGSMKGA